MNRYGSRPVVMFGGLLCGVGMISAAFCTSILQLYICVGFITGENKAAPSPPPVSSLLLAWGFHTWAMCAPAQAQWGAEEVKTCEIKIWWDKSPPYQCSRWSLAGSTFPAQGCSWLGIVCGIQCGIQAGLGSRCGIQVWDPGRAVLSAAECSGPACWGWWPSVPPEANPA